MLVCLNPYRFPNSIAISETMIVGAAPIGPTSLYTRDSMGHMPFQILGILARDVY